jgi:hypothetical protein
MYNPSRIDIQAVPEYYKVGTKEYEDLVKKVTTTRLPSLTTLSKGTPLFDEEVEEKLIKKISSLQLSSEEEERNEQSEVSERSEESQERSQGREAMEESDDDYSLSLGSPSAPHVYKSNSPVDIFPLLGDYRAPILDKKKKGAKDTKSQKRKDSKQVKKIKENGWLIFDEIAWIVGHDVTEVKIYDKEEDRYVSINEERHPLVRLYNTLDLGNPEKDISLKLLISPFLYVIKVLSKDNLYTPNDIIALLYEFYNTPVPDSYSYSVKTHKVVPGRHYGYYPLDKIHGLFDGFDTSYLIRKFTSPGFSL